MIRSGVPVSCNRDCGGGCPLTATVENGKIIRIADNPLKTPEMHGCPRGYYYADTVYAQDRLLRPLIRSGERGSGRFREASWEEAVSFAAGNMERLFSRYGAGTFMHLGGSGSCRGAVHNIGRLAERFFNTLGGYTGTDSNYSSRAVSFAMPYVYGTKETGFDAPTLKYSKLIILWGANILDTRFGCDLVSWVEKRKNEGVQVLVIDPRRTRTVKKLADQWIPIYPGTDSACLSAVLYVLMKNGSLDRAGISRYCSGYGDLESMILGEQDGTAKTPVWAEKICGVPADKIEELAGLYAEITPVALIPGLSIQRTLGGEETSRLCAVVQAVTGNAGIPGGSSGGNIWSSLPQPDCPVIPPLRGKGSFRMPVYTWADEVLSRKREGGSADIRGLYIAGGNYLVQGSDIRKNIRAMMQSEFTVCHELFLTASARYADVIFPSTTFLEREDIVFPGMNYLFYSAKAVEPRGEVKDDYEIFSLLSEKLGNNGKFTEGRTPEEWVESCIAGSGIPDAEVFRRTGIYDGEDHLRTAFSDFRSNPEQYPLATPSGRIELSSPKYAETGYPAAPFPRIALPDADYPLRLVTPHARFRVNSQNFNIKRFINAEPQYLFIHPQDAAAAGLREKEVACVESKTGKMEAVVAITEHMVPGVLSLSQGGWPSFQASDILQENSPNFCTSAEPTLPSSGSRTHSVFVRIAGRGSNG